METGIEDRAGLVPSLREAIQLLIQSTNTITSQAQSVKSLADDANSSGNLPITEVCSLREGIKKLADITSNLETTIDALNKATETSVIKRLRSLGSPNAAIVSQGPPIQKLFSHFDKQIKDIVHKVLDNTSDQNVLWRVAEECYKQATSPSGILRADDYFNRLEEACPQWPYDPDFESEEYYEHENSLDVDEDYAKAFRVRMELRSEASRKDRQSWIDFWISVLNNSPGGPTLFYPPASLSTEFLNLDAVPRYLFRTFDRDSLGRNDDSVIASIASLTQSQESGRTDILALEKDRATELLFMHLSNSRFGWGEADNLMSWTSSLIFAIQCAVWRLHSGRSCSSDIKICTVDTRNFPLGQFMRDLSLLRAYHATAEQRDARTRWIFDFRPENEDYYNGEYLSQGTVNHSNRSCVVSLEHLIQAGLYQLYPEFGEAGGGNRWTKRVLELRQNWSGEQVTTDREIELALSVGRNCFNQFEPFDIACILLTFENRKYSRLTPTSNPQQRPEWADKPDEVRRYWIATEAANSYNALPHARICLLSQHRTMLREIFD